MALTPKRMDSFVYLATSRSARKSKSRHEESSGKRIQYQSFLLTRNMGRMLRDKCTRDSIFGDIKLLIKIVNGRLLKSDFNLLLNHPHFLLRPD